MLDSLFIGQLVETVAQALDAAGVDAGTVAVIGQARAARALAERGHRVMLVAERPKSLRRAKNPGVSARLDRLPMADGALAALVAFDASQRDDWDALIAEWSRAVMSGGAIVLVDRGSPSDLTRRALCGGLVALEQRQTGRTFVTSGQVSAVGPTHQRLHQHS